MKTSKFDLCLTKLKLVTAERNASFLTPLQKLAYMIDMTRKILIKYQNIVHNATESSEVLEGLVHPTVIVFTDGGEAKRCTHELIAPKRRDKGSEELTVLVQWALVIPLESIQDSEVLGFGSSNVSYCYCRRCGLEALPFDKAVEA